MEDNLLSTNPWYNARLEEILDNEVEIEYLDKQDLYSLPLSTNSWYCEQLEKIRDRPQSQVD
jgi:hypothetical protein